MSWALAVLLSTVLGAGPIQYVEIPWTMTDLADDRRIELSFVNESELPICLNPESWPNQSGKINEPGNDVALIVEGERFVMVQHNTGYCFGDDCTIRVAPGERVTGVLWYKDFKLPKRLWRSNKKLEFRSIGVAC
jgi:hypothetical protein